MKYKSKSQIHLNGLMGKIWTELGLDLNQWIIGLITFLANSVGVVLQVALVIGDIGKQSHLKEYKY